MSRAAFNRKKEIKKRNHNITLPSEEKDSYKWVEALQNTYNTLKDEKIKFISICDREANIYDFFKLATTLKTQVIVRAKLDQAFGEMVNTFETSINLYNHLFRS